MRGICTTVVLLAAAGAGIAQDQQLGARTKAMGGSYTAFEDDPVSVWLNPAGIATQPDQASISYQSYTAYPVDQDQGPGSTLTTKKQRTEQIVDPASDVPDELSSSYRTFTEKRNQQPKK